LVMQCDKDAVAATYWFAVRLKPKLKGSSVYKELLKLYVDNGFYKEHLVSLTKKRNGRIARNQSDDDWHERKSIERN
jgi:hypothetical protein